MGLEGRAGSFEGPFWEAEGRAEPGGVKAAGQNIRQSWVVFSVRSSRQEAD